VLESGSTQGPEVVALAQSAGLDPVRLQHDLSGKPRFVFAQAP
jgi:methylase of polypeptide subunit release factors